MARENKRRNKRKSVEKAKEIRQALPEPSKPPLKWRGYTVWAMGVVIIAVVGISGWALYRNLSHAPTRSSGISESGMDPGNSGGSTTGGPQITFPESEFNFGTIAQGAKVSHTFVVKNTGDAPLKLIKAAGS